MRSSCYSQVTCVSGLHSTPSGISSLTEKQAVAPMTAASRQCLIANRLAVVQCEPLGHFLFFCLPSLTVLWVSMGRSLNFKERLFHTESVIVSFLNTRRGLTWFNKTLNHAGQDKLTAESLRRVFPKETEL